MEVNTITNILLDSQAWKIGLFIIVSMIFVDVFKYIASTFFEYITLKTDLIGIGTTVEYQGKHGIVTFSVHAPNNKFADIPNSRVQQYEK